MEQRVIYYILTGSAPFWKEINEKFKNHLSASGVPYFKEETGAEAEFVRFCSERGIQCLKKVILEFSGKGPINHPFYYFCVRDTREYNYESVRLNCDGGGKIICWNGARQIKKVTITRKFADLLTQNDIAVKNFPLSPRIYLITRKLKELIQSSSLTGFAVVPCLEEGKSYSEKDLDFSNNSQELEQNAKYFQLIISAKTLNPPNAGNLLQAANCPRCKIVTIMNTDKEWCFSPRDLNSTDFQFFSEFISDNQGRLNLTGEIPIISSKALEFFFKNQIKGLKVYSVDPPIKYAVVELK